MKVEVLISCMFQKNEDIIKNSNISTDSLVINQTNCNDYKEYNLNNSFKSRMISTTERGLSKSRNMALRNAVGDICLICDDDEILDLDYENKIISAFNKNKDADLIIFKVSVGKTSYHQKKYKEKPFKVNYLSALKVTSWQIAFRRDSIINNNIFFDESVGSGVSKAGGEENIFLHDCLRKGLKIQYEPIHIGVAIQGESQWALNIFTKEYFYDRGIFTQKLYGGKLFASIYAIYFSIRKYTLYRNKTSFIQALFQMFKGIFNI